MDDSEEISDALAVLAVLILLLLIFGPFGYVVTSRKCLDRWLPGGQPWVVRLIAVAPFAIAAVGLTSVILWLMQ